MKCAVLSTKEKDSSDRLMNDKKKKVKKSQAWYDSWNLCQKAAGQKKKKKETIEGRKEK